jgi:hypothetical protein
MAESKLIVLPHYEVKRAQSLLVRKPNLLGENYTPSLKNEFDRKT